MFSQKSLIFTILILLLLLSLRLILVYQNKSNYIEGQTATLETTLLSEPTIKGNFQRFSVASGFGDKVFITAPRFPEYSYGQDLKITGVIEYFQPQKSESTSSQKSQVLKNAKPMMTMFMPKIEAKENGLALFSSIRQKLILIFNKTLPPTSSSLLLGIVFGIKTQIPKEFSESLKTAGVMHVIAASGMNVTMVGGFLSGLFIIFFKRQYALALTIFGILFYALLSGFQPSIVRASIMGIMVFSAQILGRQSLPIYALGLAGYLMLVIEPSLIFDIGFQLSFLSTLGLIYIKPVFETEGIKKIKKKLIIADDFTTTIAAQLATLPILFLNFGSYSMFSIVVNCLVLWTVPILMVFGGLGAISGFIFEPLGRIFLYLSLPFLSYFEKIVTLFSNIPALISLNQNTQIPWQIPIGYYFILISLIIFLKKVKFQKI